MLGVGGGGCGLGVGGWGLGVGDWGLIMVFVLVLGSGCVVFGVQSEVKCK